jgi:hypothetical protein
MGDGFTVVSTTAGTGTTITEGDSLTLTAGDGISTTGTSDGVVTIVNTYTSNVSTNLSLGTRTSTTMDVDSSDGDNATLVEADTNNAGLLGSDKWDEIVANTDKVSDVDHNVDTNLSLGTKTTTTMDVDSSDGTNATLIEADTNNAGLLGADKWDEIVANTNHAADSSQAHSDYLINNGDDTTSGIITAAGFYGAILSSVDVPTIDYGDGTTILTSVGEYSGEVIKSGNDTVIAGNLHYLKSDGVWTPANATAESTSVGVLLAVAVGTNSTTHGMLVRGIIQCNGITDTEVVGSRVYVGISSGQITTTVPTSGEFVRVVGYALGTSKIYFNPDSTWVEIA